jgi:hypothetical protein
VDFPCQSGGQTKNVGGNILYIYIYSTIVAPFSNIIVEYGGILDVVPTISFLQQLVDGFFMIRWP